MVDNNNKIPDPQFEELGWRGWPDFKSKFEEIRRDYDQYGEIVLEKKLGESKDIYRDAFVNNTDFVFIKEIYKIWRERYHYVADTLADIISFYEKYKSTGFFKNNFLCSEELQIAKEATFSLTQELYDYIVREAKKVYALEKSIFVLEGGSNLYKFTLHITDGPVSWKYDIKMEKVNIVKID